MEKPLSTDILREVAPDWNLDGDHKLYHLLENIHQKITSKCAETSKKLKEMTEDLDNVSVSLQNVNNRFSSLSNSQFVESRVYDDDTDELSETIPNKTTEQQPPVTDRLTALTASIATIEEMHEAVTILNDSDSDSTDCEEAASVVLKPIDLYTRRPLPYVIGSSGWKSKWHAGLILEESDTESTISKPDEENELTDSESSTHEEINIQTHKHTEIDRQPSVGSYDTIPEQQISEDRIYKPQMTKVYDMYHPPLPLFSNEPPALDEVESDSSEENLFNENQSVEEIKPYDDGNKSHKVTNDLFEELRGRFPRSEDVKSNQQINPAQVGTQKQTLLSTSEDRNSIKDIPTDVETKHISKKPIGATSIFGSSKGADSIGAAILKRSKKSVSSSENEDFEEHVVKTDKSKQITKNTVVNKKDVISVTNSDVDVSKIQNNEDDITENIQHEQEEITENSIFDELFAKSVKSNKITNKSDTTIATKQPEKETKKIDIFSDIFDDIDDIFTTKTKTDAPKKKPSIFDEVEDDLFADIGVKKVSEEKGKKIATDELFNEEAPSTTQPSPGNTRLDIKETKQINVVTEKDEKDNLDKDTTARDSLSVQEKSLQKSSSLTENSNERSDNNKINVSKTKSLFESENDDDDIFTSKPKKSSQNTQPINAKTTKSIFDDSDDEDLFSSIKAPKSKEQIKEKIMSSKNDNSASKKHISEDPKELKPSVHKENSQNEDLKNDNRPSVFDEDDTENLFASEPPPLDENISKEKQKGQTTKIIKTKSENVNSKSKRNEISLFDDDDDDLFVTKSVEKQPQNEPEVDIGNTKPSSKNRDPDFNLAKNIPTSIVHEKTDEVKFTDSIVEEKSITNMPANRVVPHFEQKSLSDVKSPLVFADDEFEELKNNDPLKTSANNVFEKPLDENITKTSNDILYNVKNKSEAETIKPPSSGKNIFQDIPDLHENDSKLEKGKEEIPYNINDDVPKHDIFSDFLDQPPVLPKSKEAKTVKNVNALFGDDSDDESLFLRKEESDAFNNLEDSKQNKDKRFNVFGDEPPDFDDVPSESDLFNAKTTKSNNKNEKSDDSLDGSWQSAESTPKIGKLKPLNFNINVNTLLPGATRKKTETRAISDSVKIPEINDISPTKTEFDIKADILPKEAKKDTDKEIATTEEITTEESKLVKSVSFKSDPDSAVLNNKIAKERARIQVKRRPSSRKARKEAVRISAIDFGDDSTDNSNSIDDLPKINQVDDVKEPTKEINSNTVNTKVLSINSEDVYIYKEPKIDVKKDIGKTEIDSSKAEHKIEVTLKDTKIADIVQDKETEFEDLSDSDEELFKTIKKSTKSVKATEKQIRKEEKDAFLKSEGTKKKNKSESTKKSLFGDSSDDEELFGGNKKSKTKKSKIFTTESDEELFGTKKNQVPKSAEIKKDKKSLFSDEDEDDNLFSSINKAQKDSKSQVPTKASSTAKPSFEDPLSMFDD